MGLADRLNLSAVRLSGMDKRTADRFSLVKSRPTCPERTDADRTGPDRASRASTCPVPPLYRAGQRTGATRWDS